jgi:hypothetical protein
VAATVAATLLVSAARGELFVRRPSRRHLLAQVTVGGRGLYVMCTPDGAWWRVRLRRHACGPLAEPPDEGQPPVGVREPRRPRPPSPSVTAALRSSSASGPASSASRSSRSSVGGTITSWSIMNTLISVAAIVTVLLASLVV